MTYQEMWALICVTIIVSSVMHDIAEDYRQGTNACVESLVNFFASIGKRCSRCCKPGLARKPRRRGSARRAGADLLRESVAASDEITVTRVARVSVGVDE